MICSARELSADQKLVIESLLGRPISEDEQISIRAMTPPSAPEWLEKSWDSAGRLGLDRLSVTGNLKHFPQVCGDTRIVTARQFLDVLAEPI